MDYFIILSVVAAALIAYLIGSIPFGYMIGKAKGVDLREFGSGNIGATNAGRVLGYKWFFVVFLLDFAKGCLPVLLAYLFYWLAQNHQLGDVVLGDVMIAAAIGACLGHVFPVYLKFKGGKAVATGLGVLTVLLPTASLLCLAVFLLVLVAFRYMSLASIVASLAAPGAFILKYDESIGEAPYFARFVVISLVAVMIIYLHRANIRRLIDGTESRVALFGKR
ncbi:MAG: glycerol-3-phosphate 1-O-acyltransferase PlsY [Planctomycetes bacterium]|nr:glycerol-3-phosphate 1-O-acyltransferase PlsY [Planctomycetota bacterium]NUQ34092.1 glycerol-3-phosphate 1-O-acyltransferase PlsY [Planctomycetaceae bacterium]